MIIITSICYTMACDDQRDQNRIVDALAVAYPRASIQVGRANVDMWRLTVECDEPECCGHHARPGYEIYEPLADRVRERIASIT